MGHISYISRMSIFVIRRFCVVAKAAYCLSHVGPSVRMYHRGSYWTDFHEIWYCGLLWKSVRKIQICLQWDKHIGHSTFHCCQRHKFRHKSIVVVQHSVLYVVFRYTYLYSTWITLFFFYICDSGYANAPLCYVLLNIACFSRK